MENKDRLICRKHVCIKVTLKKGYVLNQKLTGVACKCRKPRGIKIRHCVNA